MDMSVSAGILFLEISCKVDHFNLRKGAGTFTISAYTVYGIALDNRVIRAGPTATCPCMYCQLCQYCTATSLQTTLFCLTHLHVKAMHCCAK